MVRLVEIELGIRGGLGGGNVGGGGVLLRCGGRRGGGGKCSLEVCSPAALLLVACEGWPRRGGFRWRGAEAKRQNGSSRSRFLLSSALVWAHPTSVPTALVVSLTQKTNAVASWGQSRPRTATAGPRVSSLCYYSKPKRRTRKRGTVQLLGLYAMSVPTLATSFSHRVKFQSNSSRIPVVIPVGFQRRRDGRGRG